MNRGVFDSRTHPERPRASLKQELRAALAAQGRNLADYTLKGHPIRWFDPKGQFARPRILLAGDAAGVDPMLGEGISFALAYGEVAAQAIMAAFDRQDFSFDDYRQRILSHPILSQLRMRAKAARLAYLLRSPRLIGWGWHLAPSIVRFLAWVNPYYVPVNNRRLVSVSRGNHQ